MKLVLQLGHRDLLGATAINVNALFGQLDSTI